jgi:hypothetical protein
MALMHEENRPIATAERAAETEEKEEHQEIKIAQIVLHMSCGRSCLGFIAAMGIAMLVGGCDQRTSAPPLSRSDSRAPTPSVATDDPKQRQADFLNRIRAADPQYQTIDRAMLNEQNELGLILDRTVEMDRVPDLMRSILTQMAREFPGQNLTVLAYTPSNPPHKIGTAQFNTQTRDMTYTPTQ